MLFYKLREDAKAPTKADGDMCYDLYACMDDPITFKTGEVAKVPTGLKIALPDGHHASLRSRSGLAANQGVDVLAGQIDNGYRGEWVVVMTTHLKGHTVQINPGDKIAQVKIEEDKTFPVVEVYSEDALGVTTRGVNGFGSTGTR